MTSQDTDPIPSNRDANQSVLLRSMTAADVDSLLPFETQMFGAEAWSRRSYLDEIADTELRCYLVATTVDGRLLGSAGLLTVGETSEVLTVGVLPAARRQGVGRTLLRALIAQAQARQAVELLLEVRVDNAAARQLYQGEGFVDLGLRRGYYEHGRVDALTMRLDLTAQVRARADGR